MKKMPLVFCAAVLCLLTLSGCFDEEGAASSTAADSSPVICEEIIPPSDDGAPQESDLPWAVPEPEEAPSYEEYFSQVVDYGYPDYDKEWAFDDNGVPGYVLTYEEPHLYLQKRQGTSAETVWEVLEQPGLIIVRYDRTWIYAIADGKELFRMDYYGGNKEVLFTDETGLLGERQGQPLDAVFDMADGKLLFFFAGTSDGGAAIYRLYLPEKRADAIYTYSPEELAACGGYLSTVRPISNYEVIWGTGNAEFEALYRSIEENPELRAKFGLDDPEYETLSEYRIVCDSKIETEYWVFQNRSCYYNAWTGEYYEVRYRCTDYPGNAWWREFQKQAAE